jgi:hypothetical protein
MPQGFDRHDKSAEWGKRPPRGARRQRERGRGLIACGQAAEELPRAAGHLRYLSRRPGTRAPRLGTGRGTGADARDMVRRKTPRMNTSQLQRHWFQPLVSQVSNVTVQSHRPTNPTSEIR